MAHHAIQLGPNNGIALLGRQADKYAHPWNQDLVGMGVNRIGKDALTDAGFAVVEAGHADDALNILTAQAQEVRALFTDIVSIR